LFYKGAQEFVALNQQQKKTKTFDELVAEGSTLISAGAESKAAFGTEEVIDNNSFGSILNTAANSIEYISSSLDGVDNLYATTQIGSGSIQYLNEQNQLINGADGRNTNVNTVVDNSVRQVSSPITTFVMQDDKVRDFHPILRNTERASLRAYSLAMR
jgi:hypothetical protein